MAGHHLILGELRDTLTNEILPDTHDERLRQGIASLLVEEKSASLADYETILWVNVLRSLSGYQAYRQSVRSRIAPVRVLSFLLNDERFPRALAHCLREVDLAAGSLPRPERVHAALSDVQAVIDSVGIREMASAALHEHIDHFQVGLANVHTAIDQSWFHHEQEDKQQ